MSRKRYLRKYEEMTEEEVETELQEIDGEKETPELSDFNINGLIT